jgi:DNA-directed RNA polymerase specialized sigma24 family protein
LLAEHPFEDRRLCPPFRRRYRIRLPGVTEEKPMSTVSSVTQWVCQLQAGDRAAAQKLWERYFQQLVRLARRKLRGTPRQAADEEDVALSAFDSFYRAAEAGRFPRLSDRDDLWQLLIIITDRKAADLAQHVRRQKRDYRKERPEGERPNLDSAGDQPGQAEFTSREPDPGFAAEVAEECRRLLGLLPDMELRTVALRKMEGYTSEEIAEDLGRSLATVERRLALIRGIWKKELAT